MRGGGDGPPLLLGNLDGEADLALLAAAPPPGGEQCQRHGRQVRHGWTRRAAAAAAAAASLLRALARPGDQLWLPAPLAADRFADLPGLPRPDLLTDAPARLRRRAELLAWCETPPAEALRERRSGGDAGVAFGAAPLHEALWRLPRVSPAVVAAVHHRAFCLQVRHRLGCELDGACMVESFAALAAHLAAGAGVAPDGPGGAFRGSWVVKAPLSAAGRWRAIHRHDLAPEGLVDAGFRRRVENLFARHGALLFEPWMERDADFGAAGLAQPDGVRWVGFHRQRVDLHGQVTGLDLVAGQPAGAAGAAGELAVDGMPDAERAVWQAALDGAGRCLGEAGYTGPFGVDAWRYRGRDGVSRLQPVGEINARLTLGLLARALVDRLHGPLGLGADDRVGLRFGVPPSMGGGGTAAGEIVPLLAGGAAGERGVWLKLDRRHGGREGS